MNDDAREEDVGRYCADIYQNYPDTFKGMSSVERYDYVKQTMLTAIEQPFTKSRGDVMSCIVIDRAAKLFSQRGRSVIHSILLHHHRASNPRCQ